MKTRFEQANELLRNCKSREDVRAKDAEFRKINVGVFVDVPHGCEYPCAQVWSLRKGEFFKHLGNRVLA